MTIDLDSSLMTLRAKRTELLNQVAPSIPRSPRCPPPASRP
jgi:hypothetical protein